jgi:hypothetical protein
MRRALLALLALACCAQAHATPDGGAAPPDACIGRVTLRAAPVGDAAEEDLWHPAASAEARAPQRRSAAGACATCHIPRNLPQQLLPLTRCCRTQEAKAACLAEARPPRRCAGFAWRRRGGFGNAGSFLPLPFERVAPLRRGDAAVDVYQV